MKRKVGFVQEDAGCDGGTLVEFALVVPFMLILITGMFSIGIALTSYMAMTNGVGVAAHALSLARGQTKPVLAATDPCAYALQAAANASPGVTRSGVTYTITWAPTIGMGGTYASSCPGLAMKAGDSIQVRAVYQVPLIIFGWKPGSFPATAQTAQVVQ